ncbi:MAG: ATP-binding protein [Luteitalea sp.]|nr:ATP-binding protein [Luteitalea sp.]
MSRSRVLVSWSSGKDSAWMLHVLREQGGLEIGGLLTTLNEAFERVAMHGVRRVLVEAQAAAARLPLRLVPLPWPCTNDMYEARMSEALRAAVADGFTHVAFGDLFLEDVKQYRERQLAGSGLSPIFPLWGRDTTELAREMLDSGLRARIVCLDPRAVPRSLAGREYDDAFLSALSDAGTIDPCGERGEFHTFAYAGPMFHTAVPHAVGETAERDGFVFSDIMAPTTQRTRSQPDAE